MKLGRNDPCPCGSGRKVKRCHAEAAGSDSKTFGWFLNTQTFLEGCEGFREPLSGPEQAEWQKSGCPYGACVHQIDQGRCEAPGCGV